MEELSIETISTKYKYGKSTLRFKCSLTEKAKCINRLKVLLNINGNLDEEEIQFQLNALLFTLGKFNRNKVKQRLKLLTRNTNIDFYYKMYELLKATKDADDDLQTIVKIPSSSPNGAKYKQFELPKLINGNRHFLTAFKEFLYQYYYDNIPIKYIKGLQPIFDDQLITDRAQIYVSKGKTYMNENILLDDGYSFQVTILALIKQFPQFKPAKRENSTLTEAQGRFIIMLTRLISYDAVKRLDLQPIVPTSIFDSTTPHAEDILYLRDKIKAFRGSLNRLRNSI